MGSTPLFGLSPLLHLTVLWRYNMVTNTHFKWSALNFGYKQCRRESLSADLGLADCKEAAPLAGLSPASAEQDLAAECSVGVILPSGSACLPPTFLNHSLGNWKPAAFSACSTIAVATVIKERSGGDGGAVDVIL